jgi:general secretion pathway protein J
MRRQYGFTLLEMLVSLSVAALLVSLVYGAVRVGQRSAQTMGKHTVDSEVMRIGWQFLRDALTRARPVQGDPENPTGFTGNANTLAFVADMPAYVGLGGLMLIELEIEKDSEGDQLILSRQRFDRSSIQPSEQGIERAVLVDDLESMEIEYFGPSEGENAPAWHTSWQEAGTLPSLVRIVIKPMDALAWPELVARPLGGSATTFDGALEDEEIVEGDQHDRPDAEVLQEDH